MKSKLISVGDEILIGQIINTNAAYLGDKLFYAGIPVEKTVVIGDEENILLRELDDSVKNYDLTVITGGLGPTHDDITKPVLVKYFNDELIHNEEVFEQVKKIFSSRNISMPDINKNQAMVPRNSDVIRNNNGTAPGIWIERSGKIIISLPGVPFEMKAMMEETVLPKLTVKFGRSDKNIMKHRTLLTTGLGESALSEKLGNIEKITEDTKLAFLPSVTGVRLRINSEADTDENAELKLKIVEGKIRSKIGDYIYGINEDKIESIIGDILRKNKKTLSVAESCTGGMISEMIVSVAGSSDYYMGGVCSYSNESKVNILGVKRETLSAFGAVSRETAIEMAEGIRRITNTDYSVSTTGIAGPAGGSVEKPVGLVWIGYSDRDTSFAEKYFFGDNRERNILRASMRALEILRRKLTGLGIEF